MTYNDTETLFRSKINPKMVQGQQNVSIPYIVRQAKYYGIDEHNAMSIVKEMWQGKFEKTDERSFQNAWKSSKTEPDVHYGDKKNSQPASSGDDQYDRIQNIAFRKCLEQTEVKPMEFDEWSERDTSILRWWFKESDWLQVVSDKFASGEKAADCKVLIEIAKPMKFFQFMSCAAFAHGDGRRKNDNVKENRLVLLESDSIEPEMQLKLFFTMIEFGLPVKSITYSGGKSYHCLLKIHPMKNVEEYKAYCEQIFSELNKLSPKLVDAANKDGVRYTRAPWGYRADKQKVQELIWCDKVSMDDEKFEFEDTFEQVKRFVSNFTCQVKEAEKITDVNGHIKYEFVSSLKDGADLEDAFICNGTYMVKLKGLELQRMSRADIWSSFNSLIDSSIADLIIEGKDDKHKRVTVDDFYFKVKDIVYDISQRGHSSLIYNMYEPGFYVECLDMDVKEMPSEFDKLLRNLADDKCREWLVNHLACYFKLLMNGFKHPDKGEKHTLETVPVFYGRSGTGKNTLMDVLGRAICKKGATDISIGNLTDDFNEFYKAGLINVNEAAKGKSERKASKEALKRFTDLWKELNQKFMPKVSLFNGAYKTISANESEFGVLDIDSFDRRFQYITGGWQKNGAAEGLLDMKLKEKQEKEFIAYLLHHECDFQKAEEVFDNEAKEEDKLMSMSNAEKISYWIWENAESYPDEFISVRTGVQWYNEMNGTKTEADPRVIGKCLGRYFVVKKQMGRETPGQYSLRRGEIVYEVASKVQDKAAVKSRELESIE